MINLQEAKDFLNVIQGDDDAKIQQLLESAEDEAKGFLNIQDWSELNQTASMPRAVRMGVLLLLQANYQATPEEMKDLRGIAEIKLMPYRKEMGF